MDDDDFSFDFESKLEEQQKTAASVPSAPPTLPSNSAVPVNQSAGSFKRNYRQVSSYLIALPPSHTRVLELKVKWAKTCSVTTIF